MLCYLVEFLLRSLGTLLLLCGELSAGVVGHLKKTGNMLALKELFVKRKSINGSVWLRPGMASGYKRHR